MKGDVDDGLWGVGEGRAGHPGSMWYSRLPGDGGDEQAGQKWPELQRSEREGVGDQLHGVEGEE